MTIVGSRDSNTDADWALCDKHAAQIDKPKRPIDLMQALRESLSSSNENSHVTPADNAK